MPTNKINAIFTPEQPDENGCRAKIMNHNKKKSHTASAMKLPTMATYASKSVKHFSIRLGKLGRFKIQKYTEFMASNKNPDYIESELKPARISLLATQKSVCELQHLRNFS